MIGWIKGWWITFHLWRHDRETYNWLAHGRHDSPDDFVDAPRPS